MLRCAKKNERTGRPGVAEGWKRELGLRRSARNGDGERRSKATRNLGRIITTKILSRAMYLRWLLMAFLCYGMAGGWWSIVTAQNSTMAPTTDENITNNSNNSNSTNSTNSTSSKSTRSPLLPDPLFTSEEFRHGGFLFYIGMALVAFVVTSEVAESDLVPALEFFQEKLTIPEGVKGAVLMASAGSMPEFMITFISVILVDEPDIGFGTIIGSGSFNILAVIGICGIVASRSAPKKWTSRELSRGMDRCDTNLLSSWPIARDSLWYILSLLSTASVVASGSLNPYAAIFLLAVYVLYVVVVVKDDVIQDWVREQYAKRLKCSAKVEPSGASPSVAERSSTDTTLIPFSATSPMASSSGSEQSPMAMVR